MKLCTCLLCLSIHVQMVEFRESIKIVRQTLDGTITVGARQPEKTLDLNTLKIAFGPVAGLDFSPTNPVTHQAQQLTRSVVLSTKRLIVLDDSAA